MKQSRRKELKTNELSQYLNQLYEAASQYTNYIIGGLVVVVLILVIGSIVRANRVNAMQAAWNQYEELSGSPAVSDEQLDEAQALADEWAVTSRLGSQVWGLQANLLYKRAIALLDEGDTEQAVKLLNEARQVNDQLIDAYDDKPIIQAEALMRQSAVLESLLMEGQAEQQTVAEVYQQLIDIPNCPYATLAEKQLNTLDDRTRTLKVVATQPAATQPAATQAGQFETQTPNLSLGGQAPAVNVPVPTTQPVGN